MIEKNLLKALPSIFYVVYIKIRGVDQTVFKYQSTGSTAIILPIVFDKTIHDQVGNSTLTTETSDYFCTSKPPKERNFSNKPTKIILQQRQKS